MTILTVCTKEYKEVLVRFIQSWLTNTKADIVIYTDFNYFNDNSRVKTVCDVLPLTVSSGIEDHWLGVVGQKVGVVEHFIKNNPGWKDLAFIDIDCYVVADFSEVFKEKFDIAATSQTTQDTQGRTTINCGVWFAHNTEGFERFVSEWNRLQVKLLHKGIGIIPHLPSYHQISFTNLILGDGYETMFFNGKMYNNRRVLYGNEMKWIEQARFAKIIHFTNNKWRKNSGKSILRSIEK